ncbi:hypothetical protein ES754_08670 [Psychrobacter frigidicola]|uniref:Uncharacterized protein n=1 Tax=Psychrobacter frigidicola TaxID=45611 RepID=A0A5C7A3A9_9GAMM|nr:hypothetical protein [Psychrobacter frigidicola]TXD97072.1 hypothetical protein ES754_08670 [Psychrobacter frigidicola]
MTLNSVNSLVKADVNVDNVTQSPSVSKSLYSNHKKLLFVTLSAALLTMSACGKKDESTIEGSALEIDSQTSEQEAAAEVERASEPMHSNREESAILPSEDMPENTGAVSEDGAIVSEDMSNNEVGINRAENSGTVDGNDVEEEVIEIEEQDSTY